MAALYTSLPLDLFVFKAQYAYLMSKKSNKFRIFTVTILYHHFLIWKKYLTFPISDSSKSDEKIVIDYMNVHNHAHVSCTCAVELYTSMPYLPACESF